MRHLAVKVEIFFSLLKFCVCVFVFPSGAKHSVVPACHSFRRCVLEVSACVFSVALVEEDLPLVLGCDVSSCAVMKSYRAAR